MNNKPTSAITSPRWRWALLAFALVLPSLYTWGYFIALDGASPAAQQAVYAGGKFVQFSLPVIWVLLVTRRKLTCPAPRREDLLWGFITGAAIFAAMCGAYWGWLKTSPLFISAVEPIREKVQGLGIDSAWKFAALGLFYSLIHSLAEEYYWRWFVFGEMRYVVRMTLAVLVSSVGFMAHHVIVLGHYFGYASPLAWLFSLGVFAGGVLWAAIYARTGRLYAPWLSHLLVDAAIFVIGYDIVRSAL